VVIGWWNKTLPENDALKATDILYDHKPESNLFQALNHFVIIANYCKISHLYCIQIKVFFPSKKKKKK